MRRLVILIAVSLLIWLGVVAWLAASIHAYGEDNQFADGQSADVIIVLGSGLRRDGRPGDALLRRSRWGADLYQQGAAPHVICTGGVGDGKPRSEADACREVLVRYGVPEQAIFLEEQSRSTEENAIYARTIMLDQGWQKAVLVTDSFHMLRANWVFDIYDITHVRSPVPREQVRSRFYNRHFTREIVALHWQAIKELLNLPHTNVG